MSKFLRRSLLIFIIKVFQTIVFIFIVISTILMNFPLWDKVEIIDKVEHWRIRRLEESAHMLGYNDLLSRPSIELNTIWEPIIKKARLKKKRETEIWIWAQVKKSYIIVVILAISKNIKFIIPKNSLWIVQQDTWRNGYRHWFQELLRRQLSEGCRFNPHYRRVIYRNTGQTESEQATPVVSIKDAVQSSMKVPEFDKHLKKAGGHIGRNVGEITIKMKTIVRKTLMIEINNLF